MAWGNGRTPLLAVNTKAVAVEAEGKHRPQQASHVTVGTTAKLWRNQDPSLLAHLRLTLPVLW